MEIKFSGAPPSSSLLVDDLKAGQCFVVEGEIFVASKGMADCHAAAEDYQDEVFGVSLSSGEPWTDKDYDVGEVYEIESITLRRVK